MFKNETLGFKEDGFKNINKIAQEVLKDQSIRNLVSEPFLVNAIFDWAISFKRNEIQDTLSDYLTQEAEKNIQSFNLYIPILFLESDRPFSLGNTRLQYLTEDYLKHLSEKIAPENRENYLKSLLHFKGQLMAICSMQAEKEKAIELAITQVTLTIDILRLLSPTVEVPELKLYFDADFRNIYQVKSSVLMQEIKNPHLFKIIHNVNRRPFVINQMVWDTLCISGLSEVHHFIIRTTHNKNELEGLVYNAIANFSKAIEMHDLHDRVVQVFTVLESLLLPNDQAPIIESVCKYLPKLVSKNSEQRKLIVTTVRAMYSVRSAMVHHAKRIDFKVEDLMTIQICARALIFQMMQLSMLKQTKKEVLQEIDEILNSA